MSTASPLVSYILKHSSKDTAELIERLSDVASEIVMLSIVEVIPEEKLQGFATLVEEGNHEKLSEFLDRNISDIPAFVDLALADLRETAQDLIDHAP